MAFTFSLKNPFAETPTTIDEAVATDPLARQMAQPEDAAPPRAIVVMEEPAPKAIVVDEQALEGNSSTQVPEPEGTPAISHDPVKDGIPQSTEPPKPEGLWPKGGMGVGEKQDLIRDGAREAKYRRELKVVEDMAKDPEKAYRGVEFQHARTREEGMTNTTVERYLMLRTDGPLPPDAEERKRLRMKIAREEFGGLGGESNEAFLSQIKLRAEKRGHHEALHGDAIHHARAFILLEAAERNQGKENPYTWESFLETAKKHPGYTEGDDIRLRETWIAAKNELDKRVGPFTMGLQVLWKHYEGKDREKALGLLLERGGLFQNMAEKSGDGTERPNPIQDFTKFMQDTGYFASLTSALSSAWDKNIWKEKTGNWNFPHLYMSTGSIKDAVYGPGNVIDHKINRRMIVEGELGSFMAGFQKRWGMDDKDMKTLWSDLGNMYREWEDEEKFRTLSNGMILPNMMHTDWLDTEKAVEMIKTSGASPEMQAVTLRNLNSIQQQIMQSKRDAYEMAASFTNTVFGISKWTPSPNNLIARAAGEFISPSDWAKQQGRYDEINDPKLLRDYEQAVIHSSPKLSKQAWGLTSDLTQGYIKVYTTLAGAAGAVGWDSAGESAAEWQDISTQIGQGQYDTGFAGKIIEELPALAVQIAVTRGVGFGVGAAARGLGAGATTAARLGSYAANLSAPMVAAGQSVGSTFSSERAAGATVEEARAKAMKAGIATALITGAFQLAGAGGVEKIAAGKPADATLRHLLAGGSRDQIAKNLRSFAKETLKQAGAEATEEALDGLISSFLTADPDTNLASAWGDAMEGAAIGGVLGVGTHTASSVLENSPDAKAAARQLGSAMDGSAARARDMATTVYDLYQQTAPEQRGALMDTIGQRISMLPEAEQAALYGEMETHRPAPQPPPLPSAAEQAATPDATATPQPDAPGQAVTDPSAATATATAAAEPAPAVSPAPQAQGDAAVGSDASVRNKASVSTEAAQAPAPAAPAAPVVSQDFAADLARIRRGEYRSGPAVPPLSGDTAATAPGKARVSEDTSPAPAIPAAVTAAIEADTHQSLQDEATRRGLPAVEASRIAGKAAPLIAAVRSVADRIGSALTTALPATAKALAALPDTLRAAALAPTSTSGKASSPTRSALAAALARDVPSSRLTNGNNGVLDGGWVEHPSSLPDLLPLALSAVATRLPGKQRADAFRNAPDHHLLALGISPADLSNIRQARNNFAATQAIEQAVTRLSPRSETALAATRQLIAEDTHRRGETQAAQGSGRQPRVIAADGGGFRVLHPTTGKEIGFAKNARDAARLADSFTNERGTPSNSSPSYQLGDDSLSTILEAGDFPRFVSNADGSWTLFDANTQEEIGYATTTEDALKLAAKHSESIAKADADQLAYLATMLDAGAFTATSDQDGVRRTTTDFRPGKRLTIRQVMAGAGRKAARMAEQLRAREIRHGGDGSITDIVFGSSTTSFKDGTRRTVNLLLDGASVSTIFHEETHGYWKEALATGRLTRDEAITLLRAVDNVLANHKGRKGSKETNLRLLPDNDADITDVMLDEAIAELREAEILRTRKDGIVPEGLISRNFAAIARLTGDRTVGKFRSFFDAIRARFGLILDRSNAIKRGLADGSINKADYEAFFGKLTGQDTGAPHLDPAKVAELIGVDEEVSFTTNDASSGDSGTLIKKATAEARKKVAAADAESIRRAGRFWLSLHGVKGVTQFPELRSKNLADLVNEASRVQKGLSIESSDHIGGEHYIGIGDANGFAYIIERDGQVWVDTSMAAGKGTFGRNQHENRKKGSMGPAIYQVAQAYARNNGLKFVPDEGGVSPIAIFRRWPHLLSSAIRMGDTSHIGGAKDVEGWKEGDHEHNAGLLAMHEYEYVRHFFPEIDHLHLSEDSSTIIDDAGAPISRTTLADLIVGDRHPKRLGVGETTLRRAIVTGQTAAEGRLESGSEAGTGEPSERRIHPGAVQDFVPDLGSGDPGARPRRHTLDGISYSVGHSTPSGDPPSTKSKSSTAKKASAKKTAKKKGSSPASPPPAPSAPKAKPPLTYRGETVDAAWYQRKAEEATRYPSSPRVILGKYSRTDVSYEKVAEGLKNTYFQLDDWTELVKVLDKPHLLWPINEAFLDQQLDAGKEIWFSHDPDKADGYFLLEVEHIRNRLHGTDFSFEPDGALFKLVRK